MEPEIKTQHPFIYDDGTENEGLIRTWCEGYTVIQRETGREYGEAIDIYPCPYTYSVGNPIEEEGEKENETSDTYTAI